MQNFSWDPGGQQHSEERIKWNLLTEPEKHVLLHRKCSMCLFFGSMVCEKKSSYIGMSLDYLLSRFKHMLLGKGFQLDRCGLCVIRQFVMHIVMEHLAQLMLKSWSQFVTAFCGSVSTGEQHHCFYMWLSNCCLHVRRHNVLFIEISEVQEENIFSTEIFIITTLMGVDMLRLGFASTKLQYP